MTPRDRLSPTVALEALALPAIDHVDLVTVKQPFVAPFGTSVHVWTDKEAMLMRLASQGVTAWSECVADPDPFYAYETNTTARHIIRDFLLPLVEPGITLGELETRFRHVRGHGMAKATVENALLILIAMQRGVALHELLGRPATKIMSGLSIGLKETQAELLDAVERALDRKYHRVKMKIRKGQDIDWVRAVRDRFPDIPLMVDANGVLFWGLHALHGGGRGRLGEGRSWVCTTATRRKSNRASSAGSSAPACCASRCANSSCASHCCSPPAIRSRMRCA